MCKSYWKAAKYPDSAIMEAKKRPNRGEAVKALASAGLAIAIATILSLWRSGVVPDMQVIAASGVAVFLVILFGGLFVSYLLTLVARILGGKGNITHGATAVAYSFAAPSLGLLVASVLLFVPLVGGIIAFLVIAVTLVVGSATLYRGVKEMFSTDMITAFVTVSVLMGMLVLSLFLGSALMGASLGGLGLPSGTLPGL